MGWLLAACVKSKQPEINHGRNKILSQHFMQQCMKFVLGGITAAP